MNKSLSPSRRPCIRGPSCQRECCNMKIKVQKKQLSLDRDRNTSQNDDENNISADDSGEDTVDGEIYNKRLQLARDEYASSESFIKPRNRKNCSSLQTNFINQSQNYVDQRDNRTANPYCPPAHKIMNERRNYRQPIMNQSVNKVWLFLIGIISIVFCYFYYVQIYIGGSEYTRDEFKLEMNAIGTEYKINRDAMLHIQNGIESTFKQHDTVSIMLLYRDMNEKLLSEFVNKVANASAKYLRTGAGNPIILKQSDLKMRSTQELIDKYRGDLESQGVVLFQNLEKIPVNLVKAFHYYCDEFNPLAKKTAVFFTLDMAKCKNNLDEDKIVVVERCLMDKWKTIHKDDLMPLISRVINIVVDLEGNAR